MNTQKVEERPKDLSILARDEEKKDIHRSILRERKKKREAAEQREKERQSQLHTFFGISVCSKNHTSESSVPHYSPTSSPFLLNPLTSKMDSKKGNTQREGTRSATTLSPAPKPAKWEYPTWRRKKLTNLDDQTLN